MRGIKVNTAGELSLSLDLNVVIVIPLVLTSVAFSATPCVTDAMYVGRGTHVAF
jgi:hypothetical protein